MILKNGILNKNILEIQIPDPKMLLTLSAAGTLQYTRIVLLQCLYLTTVKARAPGESDILRAPSEIFMGWVEEVVKKNADINSWEKQK